MPFLYSLGIKTALTLLRILGPGVLKMLGVKSVYIQAFIAILELLGAIPLTKEERVTYQQKAANATKMQDMQEIERIRKELEELKAFRDSLKKESQPR